jgi:hypothetical protein
MSSINPLAFSKSVTRMMFEFRGNVKIIFPIVLFLIALPLAAQISNARLEYKQDTNAPAGDAPKPLSFFDPASRAPVKPGAPLISNKGLATGPLFASLTNTNTIQVEATVLEDIPDTAPQVFDFPPGTTVRKPLLAVAQPAPGPSPQTRARSYRSRTAKAAPRVETKRGPR